MPRERAWEEDDDSEAEDIEPLKDRAGGNIVIPIQTGMPAADMVDLADAMKDTAADEETPAAPGHMEVQDAVLKDTEDVSMAAGPPTIKVPPPSTGSVQAQPREKRKRVVLSP